MKIEISVDELNGLLNLISPEKVEKIIELIAPAEPQEEPAPQKREEPNPFWQPNETYSGTSTGDPPATYKVFNEQTK